VTTTDRSLEPSKVGRRLREERERRGVSLRELARRVGVSPSLVSQIELDRVNPSVSTLYALVTELGLTMSDVFGDETPREPQIVRAKTEKEGLVATPETRSVLNLASGVRWERLTPHSDPEVEFLHVVYPVGGESCSEDALVTHGGREYGYVASGTLGVRVGFDEYVLGPGASIASTRLRLTVCGRSATSRSAPSGSSSAGRPTRARRTGRVSPPGLRPWPPARAPVGAWRCESE
jgi:Predicted transcriptional regulators